MKLSDADLIVDRRWLNSTWTIFDQVECYDISSRIELWKVEDKVKALLI